MAHNYGKQVVISLSDWQRLHIEKHNKKMIGEKISMAEIIHEALNIRDEKKKGKSE